MLIILPYTMKVLLTKGVSEGKNRVFIAIPSYRDMGCDTAYSLFAAKEVLLRNNIESELCIVTDSCHVDDNRNYLVREFLESKCDNLVFIDSDLRFDAEDLVKLIMYPFDVVAGIYPKKSDKDEFPVGLIPGEQWSNEYGLLEVERIPTGFLKISRFALESLYEIVPKYVPPTEQKYHKLRIPLIFERTIQGNSRLGGDYEFSRKWKNTGGKIYVDPHMRFAHIGNTEWHGTLANHLYRKNGMVDDLICHKISLIKENKATLNDYIQLYDTWDNKWSLPIDLIVMLKGIVENISGNTIEIGSGLSTLIMAASGKHIISIENNKEWYDKVNKFIERCNLDVDLRLVPLHNGWYDTDIQEEFNCIVVDAPARDEGDRSIVVDKIKPAKDCLYIIDDIAPWINKIPADFKYYDRFAIGKYKN